MNYYKEFGLGGELVVFVRQYKEFITLGIDKCSAGLEGDQVDTVIKMLRDARRERNRFNKIMGVKQ